VTDSLLAGGTSANFGPLAEGEALPMHLEMLTKAGIRLMENIYMEEIVKQKIYEFCLFAAPLKIKGGTASPIRLLALI
jgi:kynurenine formamidase